MTAGSIPPQAEPPARSLDPVAILRRDNTLLEMLATGFRRLGSSLDTTTALDEKRIEEGLEIHRRFLVEIHHTIVEMLDGALDQLPGSPLKAARGACRREHDAAVRASEGFRRDFDAVRRREPGARNRFKAALFAEADRWTAHARAEEENLFAQLPDSFRREAAAHVGDLVRRFRAESSAVEERLSSWTSSWGPASD